MAMSDGDRKLLEKNRPQLISGIELEASDLLDQLLSRGALTTLHIQAIEVSHRGDNTYIFRQSARPLKKEELNQL